MEQLPPPSPPPFHPYWFYSSPFLIDDPLAPFPIPTSTSAVKYAPRPFSRIDSTALEDAYQDLRAQRHARSFLASSLRGRRSRSNSGGTVKEVAAEGHPTFRRDNASYSAGSEVDLAGEMVVKQPVRKDSGSPLRGQFSGSPGNVTAGSLGTSPNAKMGTTRNPFIRSLTLARSQAPESRAPSTQRSTKKSSPPPTPPVQTEIPVGIQRLHKVLLPSFVMTPIYWSPLQDVASVVRGTWFYKDTMLPVETEIANRLELGWEEVRAWSEEWEMELVSAVEVGREGEEKVRWQLWDKASLSAPPSRPDSATGEGEGMVGFDGVSPTALAGAQTKPNEYDWVLFANGTDAYICRDTMLSFGNKRPLANIRKGKTVGTHLVRGFQEDEWERLHPSKCKKKATAPLMNRKRSASSTSNLSLPEREREKRACSASGLPGPHAAAGIPTDGPRDAGLGPDEEERTKVTELFLVIHGIGQKLSERVESFHFTHAINSFRRHINAELRDPAVKPYLRNNGDVGVMVLPINWRHSLTFEDGMSSTPKTASSNFSLADITPPSIPAVRNLIGDVMLDIPYYLSHHKQKMIEAVIREANRVYRLWCANNSHFEKEGRVHIIAHSLGSAIAMDILSKQPTRLDIGLGGKVSGELFEFDTKSVFFVGCPAGFFLLLNKSGLIPRKGRNKPGAAGEDVAEGVAGEAGTYGCLAADNIYNVLHYSDPIACLLNPTVDTEYAASIKTAYIPSSAPSLLSSIFRFSSSPSHLAPIPTHPPINRLPSTIELETHDFSREELAEKRMYLLNDNGQLDWYLSHGVGAMENQYLNMLGAHSSYWESRDFVRFCVGEVGRVPGRNGGGALAVKRKVR